MYANIRLWLAAALFLYSVSTMAEIVIDEIIVTADFRERPTTEIPSSVTVMDASFIEATAVQHFEELVNLVPNLNWSGDGHRARYFQIRGVGELEQYQGAPNPSIGFLIDDIDFSGIGTIATLFDIASVEVLRGPQGSRYGANALGGLIYLRSTAPSAERNGRLFLTVGDDDARSIGLAMGGAIDDAETATFRISAQQHESNGFRDNTFLNREDTNGRDETTVRGRLRFEPSENFEANVSVLYAKIDNGYDAFSLDNTYTMLSDKPGKDAQESLGASLRLDWSAFGGLTMTSITSFADSDINFGFDADWGNDNSWAPVTYDYVSSSDRARKTLGQEFRLGSDRWLVGLYASKLDDAVLTVNLGDYYDPFYDWADSLDDSFGSDYEATNVALFGQFDHDFTTATRLSSGLRIEHRSTDYFDTAGVVAGPAETMWGGELSLTHALRDSANVYASVSKGYKAGGFNLGVVPAGRRDFGTENMVTLEVGIKSNLQGGRLRVNAAVFHNRRNDQQVRASEQLVLGDPASFVFFTDNVGEGKALGFETEVHWFPTDDWELYATVGLIDATFESGREMAHAPPFTLAVGVNYHNPNGFFARLDATAKDAFYFDVNHDQKSEPFELLNARVGYEGESWQVSLWAKNLFDRDYAVRGFYFGNEPPDFPNTLYTRLGDPRQIGITIEKRF
jgi:outer membrane receptor protein involved in Fe transport